MAQEIQPTSLDHVALWVDQRQELADFLCDYLGMHPIEETDTFTLVGVDAKLGKLTLFDAEGRRRRGSLERIGLRVGNLSAAVSGLPQSAGVRRENSSAVLEAPNGVPIVLVERGGTDFDLDHVVLRLPDREGALAQLEEMGFERRGVEVDDVKDAPNTFAVFLRGPAGVRIEYVEHKPGFALV